MRLALTSTLQHFITTSLIILTINNHLSFSYSQPSLDDLERNDNKRYCDRELCDSLVNKCIFTERCSCKFDKNASCAKDCIDCLEEKFGKCCACVDLCPVIKNDTESSHVGNITNSDQQFFEVMTEDDDIHGRWRVMKSTSSIQISHQEHGQIELAYRANMDNSSIIISHDNNLRKLNCTVAFINRYLSMTKCKRSCTTLRASFFRWFNDGCCECIGKYCFKYGLDKPHCLIPSD